MGSPNFTLTFNKANTGLPFSFSLFAPGSAGVVSTGFTYNDNEGAGVYRTGVLSPGDINNGEDDDVHITFLDGQDVYGIGFEIVDSGAVADEETIKVYGPSASTLIGTFDIPAHGQSTRFYGVISPIPIARVEFDEDAGETTSASGTFATSKALAVTGSRTQ